MGALFYVIDEYIEQVNTEHCKLYKKLSHSVHGWREKGSFL